MTQINTDFLIIGSGVAGLTFALKVAEFGSVALVTKKGVMDSNTSHAQGGIASVFDKVDSFDLHIRDTLASGDGLCNRDVVEMVVKNGPDRIRELVELGVHFNLKEKGLSGPKSPGLDIDFDLGREGGHSQKRIVHTHDMTGMELESVLVTHVKNHDRITLFENHIAIDLVTISTRMKRGLITTTHEDYCCGVYVLDRQTNQVKTFCAKITLLATGGAGKVYLYTSNPDIATGVFPLPITCAAALQPTCLAEQICIGFTPSVKLLAPDFMGPTDLQATHWLRPWFIPIRLPNRRSRISIYWISVLLLTPRHGMRSVRQTVMKLLWFHITGMKSDD